MIAGEKGNDIDIAVYAAADDDPHELSADLKVELRQDKTTQQVALRASTRQGRQVKKKIIWEIFYSPRRSQRALRKD